MNLSDSVLVIKNVGASRKLALENLGIFTVFDLLSHFPRRYQDRSKMVSVSNVTVGAVNTVVATVDKPAENVNFNGKLATKLEVTDGLRKLTIVWFNQPYMRLTFKRGEEVAFTGFVTTFNGKYQMQFPDYEKMGDFESLSFGRIIPLYPLSGCLTQKMLRGLIKQALDATSEQFGDFLPENVRLENDLCDKMFAVSNIHFPESDEGFFVARKRLVFEELFLMQTALFKLKGIIKRPLSFKILNVADTEILEQLPFKMTNAQAKVIEEIKEDLLSGFVMSRLIQGDVGSGKTAVAMVCAHIVLNSAKGAQVAIMAPTEVLARQHYLSFGEIFDKLNVDVTLLSGSLSTKEKKETRAKIANGQAQIVIGTHALIQKSVEFKNLRLVVTDEQHRFGVKQRETLTQKGETAHTIVMTATPIPRTLALILYGDMDISIIDELPPGRKKVDTYAVGTSYRPRLFAFVQKEVDAGRQAFIICPLIEEKQKETTDEQPKDEKAQKKERQAVKTYTETIQKALPTIVAECLHGKMKNEMKTDIMARFANNEINVVVSTTVIEVGINVPNATVMIVENAENFGLSQLHQLRGRVGRGGERSYCVLVTDSGSEVCASRMKAMTQTNDGFVISEMDLELRGPGDFFGTKQHGLPELKIANLYEDIEILKQAQAAAFKIIEEDENFEKLENKPLLQEVEKFFCNIEKVGL